MNRSLGKMEIKKWLVENNDSVTSIFHIGSYCKDWKASTFKEGKPSFHLIMEGSCWLQLGDNERRRKLNAGDMVFFFTNQPFFITSSDRAHISDLPWKKMLSINSNEENKTGLLCGFLEARNMAIQLLFSLMPDVVIVSEKCRFYCRIKNLFEILKVECQIEDNACEIAKNRLTDLLLQYIIEGAVEESYIDVNVLKTASHQAVLKLSLDILGNPRGDWSIQSMADAVHMSRSTFIRKIEEITSYTPNEFLTSLRMHIAKSYLKQGYRIDIVSHESGYESVVGFYKAFKRATGASPKAWSDSLVLK